MPAWLDRLLRRWEDRAALGLEHHLEPGLRRRLDRFPSRLRGRLELRAERRARHRDVGPAIEMGRARAWTAGFSAPRREPPRW